MGAIYIACNMGSFQSVVIEKPVSIAIVVLKNLSISIYIHLSIYLSPSIYVYIYIYIYIYTQSSLGIMRFEQSGFDLTPLEK